MTRTDFNFLAGKWVTRQRRLVEILAECDQWYEFDATLECQVLLDGYATFDVLRAPERGMEGITLRLYSPADDLWRIWWATRDSGGQLDVPVVGRFEAGVGTFECDDTWNGTPIRVRYQWLDVDTPTPQWQQSFSADEGQTWELNWTAIFTRAT